MAEPLTIELPVIERGDKGTSVELLQLLLNHQGFDAGVKNGFAGRKTVCAVRRFQDKHGLTFDGICGAETWAKLLQFNEKWVE